MTDVGPPLGKARDNEAESAVHEFKMAKAKPSMDNGLKLRRSSCLTPSAAKWASSARTLCLPPVDDFLGAISSSVTSIYLKHSYLFLKQLQQLPRSLCLTLKRML
ncbi:hypothetical protein B0A54_09420 [Friedmanniomyces endolithicus]|uniref:Uncharacterized protein n=1 Tax=Friedmanniomyces endolithicus TaxID=329885 RepID=A0A4U0UWE0_9PEZI|nr:hypothetical protein B0A54_09420 [Friedmanniomyces endolithicus]